MKTLTEVDTFSATIVVPEGVDSRNTAAEDVESIAQRLANRTKNLTLHAARIDVANVFTQPQTMPDLAIGSDLTVGGDATIPSILGSVSVAGGIDSGGDIFATDDLISGDQVQVGAEVVYVGVKTRVLTVPIHRAIGNSVVFDPTNNRITTTNPGDAMAAFSLSCPIGSVLRQVDAIISEGSLFQATFQLVKLAANYASPFTTRTVVASGVGSASPGAVLKTTSLNWGGEVVAANTEYLITWTPADTTTDDIRAVRVALEDPGPRGSL